MERKITRYGSLILLGKKNGIVMVVAIIIVLLLTVLGLGALLTGSIDLLTSRSQREGKEAFYAAEGGIVYGTKELDSLLATTLSPSSVQLAAITSPSIPGFSFDAFSVAATGSSTNVTITSGPYAGLNSISSPYTITVQATGVDTASGTVRLSQSLQNQLIPLFQFGVFYNDDLEIFPGPDLTFNGRIHTNSDLYVGGSATYDSRISSAGDISRCRKDNTSSCSSAQIRTPGGSLLGLTYDHTDSDWATRAYNDWGGLVQDSAHGVQGLDLPLGTTDFTDLINRGDTIDPVTSTESQALKDSRMYWKADIRIIDGVAYDKNGTTVTLPAGAISTASFYDYREGKTVITREIDCNNLGAIDTDGNGNILYVSDTQDNPSILKATRLTNCSILPAGGLTVASDNPIYVNGNYNSSSKKGAAIIGDAVTFLSNSWTDSYSPSTSTNNRVASNTTVNAAVVIGNDTTSVGNYNGGLENLPRFLEKWSGITFTYTGSLINLWRGRQATGPWVCCASAGIYAPPNRNWSYDTDFDDPANLPPGTPRVRTMARTQWTRK